SFVPHRIFTRLAGSESGAGRDVIFSICGALGYDPCLISHPMAARGNYFEGPKPLAKQRGIRPWRCTSAGRILGSSAVLFLGRLTDLWMVDNYSRWRLVLPKAPVSTRQLGAAPGPQLVVLGAPRRATGIPLKPGRSSGRSTLDLDLDLSVAEFKELAARRQLLSNHFLLRFCGENAVELGPNSVFELIEFVSERRDFDNQLVVRVELTAGMLSLQFQVFPTGPLQNLLYMT